MPTKKKTKTKSKVTPYTVRRSRNREFGDWDGYVVVMENLRIPIVGIEIGQQEHLAKHIALLLNGVTPAEWVKKKQVNKTEFTGIPRYKLKDQQFVGRKVQKEFFEVYASLAFSFEGRRVPLPILVDRAMSSMRITEKKAKKIVASLMSTHLLEKVKTRDGVFVVSTKEFGDQLLVKVAAS